MSVDWNCDTHVWCLALDVLAGFHQVVAGLFCTSCTNMYLRMKMIGDFYDLVFINLLMFRTKV